MAVEDEQRWVACPSLAARLAEDFDRSLGGLEGWGRTFGLSAPDWAPAVHGVAENVDDLSAVLELARNLSESARRTLVKRLLDDLGR